MASSIARSCLVLASAALLVACFSDAAAVLVAALLAVAVFPPALFLLTERDGVPGWLVLLALSLTGGLFVAGYWHGSPYLFGLPAATWLCWLLLGLLPFGLTAYGVVFRRGVR